MASQVCPVCSKLYDGSEDHPFDPCEQCWKDGWRVDACHNVYHQENKNASLQSYLHKRR